MYLKSVRSGVACLSWPDQSFFLLILSRHNWIVSKGEINNCYIFGMFFKENILIYCEIKKAM